MHGGDCKVNAYIRSFVCICFLYLVLLKSKYMPLQHSSHVKTQTLYQLLVLAFVSIEVVAGQTWGDNLDRHTTFGTMHKDELRYIFGLAMAM